MNREAQLAFGRILRMAARSNQAKDVAEYERCRAIILNALEGVYTLPDTRPCWVRDRNKGSQGD